MLWGWQCNSLSLWRVGVQKLFAVIGELFMDYSSIVNVLPFWILGVPLAVAIISFMKMPRQSAIAPPDRREERHNIVREPAIRSGDTVISRG